MKQPLKSIHGSREYNNTAPFSEKGTGAIVINRPENVHLHAYLKIFYLAHMGADVSLFAKYISGLLLSLDSFIDILKCIEQIRMYTSMYEGVRELTVTC